MKSILNYWFCILFFSLPVYPMERYNPNFVPWLKKFGNTTLLAGNLSVNHVTLPTQNPTNSTSPDKKDSEPIEYTEKAEKEE